MANLTDIITPSGLATAAQGGKADTALQNGSLYATAAQGTLADDAAPLVSAALTGTPTAPTATTGTNTTQVATTAFVAALVVDPTLNSFQRATAISDTFTVQYAKTTTDAGVVSMYKEVASADETSNVFSATAAATAFEFDATKLAFSGGSLGLKVVGTAGFDLATASYDSVSFSVTAQDSQPYGMTFSTDGTKMFILGHADDTVHQYTLSTGFDLSTASYDSVSFSVASQDTLPEELAFNTDGTKMLMVGRANDSVYQYTLSTGFDVSTASYDSVSFSVTAQEANPGGMVFNTAGTKMFICGSVSNSVFQYTLSTGFDLSTASYDSVSFSVVSQVSNAGSIALSTDGTKLIVLSTDSDTLYQYTLSTGFDVSTASYDSVSFSVASEEGQPKDITFNADGTKMFIIGVSADAVLQYSTGSNTYTANEYLPAITSNPLDTEFWTELTSITASDTLNSQSAFYAFSSDSRASWLIMELGGTAERTIARNNGGTWEYNSNVTYGSETWVSASVNTESSALSDAMSVSVNRMGGAFGSSFYDLAGASYDSVSFSVNAQESGAADVAFNNDGTKMYVVGSNIDSVFQYTLSTGFDVSTASYDSVSFSVNAQEIVPTAIAFNTDGTKMYIAGNNSDRVFQYTLSTGFDVSTASYDSVAFSVNPQDASPFAIAFNNDGTKMYMAGDINNSIYQYSLSTGFDLSTASYDSVSFSVASQDTEPYGITFNTGGTKMYVLGFNGGSVFQYTLSTGFDVSTASYDSVSFSPGAENTQPKALRFNTDGTKMFLLGASDNSIYQYSTGGSPTYTALADSLSEAVILHTTDTTVTPSYTRTAIVYDANAQYTLLTPVTDYDVKLGTNQATITSKVAGNIKGRIV
jgi:sugar lactone lactonase YvrE